MVWYAIRIAQYGSVWTILFQFFSLAVWVVLLIESSSLAIISSNIKGVNNTLIGFQDIIQKVQYLHCIEVSENMLLTYFMIATTEIPHKCMLLIHCFIRMDYVLTLLTI